MEQVLEEECRGRIYARIKGHAGGAITYPPAGKMINNNAISNAAKDVIKAFLQPFPRKRLTGEEFLQTEWCTMTDNSSCRTSY
jgi:hypothetical protein